MTTTSAAQWFYTQPIASLTNPIGRAAFIELLSDPANALAIFQQRFPLRLSTTVQDNALTAVFSGNTELLTRLPIDWSNPLELAALSSVLSTSYAGSVLAGVPLLLYKFDELSGNLINYGSLGSALNATVANATVNQSGPNATVPKAYTYNGTTTIITIPVSTGLASTNWTFACLIKPSSAGEANFGRIFELLTTAGAAAALFVFEGAVTGLTVMLTNTAGTGFTTTTNTLGGTGTGTWLWLFLQYNDTTKQVTVWRSVSSVLTQFGTGTQQTLTGTARQIGQGYIGNNAATTRTFAGDFAQVMLYPSLLTTAQMQAIVTNSGV